jgi:predicted enzyme related to lactoylglutathione lyase
VWHDLLTLFGWTFEPAEGVDPGYTIIKNGELPIGGIVERRPSERDITAQWLSYVVVADVNRAAQAFQAAGGRLLRGPLDARGDLRVAAVEDGQGAALGLASRGPRRAAPHAVAVHDWLWMDYVAEDPDSALKFYADVIGFRYEVAEQREDFTYYVLSTDRPRAGLFRSVWKHGASAWLPHIRVEDPAAMAARVDELGGSVLLPVQPRVRNGSLAIVVDPAGAVIALQKFPFDKGAPK